jgi:branched-chain amino acid transport system ATP-binding protein
VNADERPGTLRDVPARPGVAKPDPILVLEGVRKSFGGLQAVDVDHLEVQRGAITALIGPNGAGKTTLFNVLTGFDRHDAGTWRFDLAALQRRRAYQVARAGMVRTFQLTKALARMTVLDNVLLAAPGQRGEHIAGALLPGWRAQERDNRERALALLERFGLTEMAGEFAGSLSGGQRKLLEMARALMAEPRMIMLDEPMAGVNPRLTASLLDHMAQLRDEGLTVLFVEHDMDVVMGISDWVVVMAGGRLIAEGLPRHVGSDPAVIDAYLGQEHGEASHA